MIQLNILKYKTMKISFKKYKQTKIDGQIIEKVDTQVFINT